MEPGVFPKPIILLQCAYGYDIVDGNHRYFTWTIMNALNKELNICPSEKNVIENKLREKWKINELAPLSILHKVWIGKVI